MWVGITAKALPNSWNHWLPPAALLHDDARQHQHSCPHAKKPKVTSQLAAHQDQEHPRSPTMGPPVAGPWASMVFARLVWFLQGGTGPGGPRAQGDRAVLARQNPGILPNSPEPVASSWTKSDNFRQSPLACHGEGTMTLPLYSNERKSNSEKSSIHRVIYRTFIRNCKFRGKCRDLLASSVEITGKGQGRRAVSSVN